MDQGNLRYAVLGIISRQPEGLHCSNWALVLRERVNITRDTSRNEIFSTIDKHSENTTIEREVLTLQKQANGQGVQHGRDNTRLFPSHYRLCGSHHRASQLAKMLKVSINFVNGDFQEWTESGGFYHKLQELRSHHLDGKELVDQLITDDWGPPPEVVRIDGTLADGTVVKEAVQY